MNELARILSRVPCDADMRGFSVGALSFSGLPAERKALCDLVSHCRKLCEPQALSQNDPSFVVIAELGRLIQKAHRIWMAAGAPGGEP